MTPTAWAHRLAQVHWGEVDVTGFSAMMWALPAQGLEDRAKQMILRDAIERHPEIESAGPEWLRDQVDDIFARGNIGLLLSAVEQENGEADAEAAFVRSIDEFLPRTAQQILDAMVKREGKR